LRPGGLARCVISVHGRTKVEVTVQSTGKLLGIETRNNVKSVSRRAAPVGMAPRRAPPVTAAGHRITPAEGFTMTMMDRVFHALLILAMVRAKGPDASGCYPPASTPTPTDP